MYCVYKATFPNGKVYIGLTENFDIRLKEHKRGSRRKAVKDYPLYIAIEKYRWENITWEIIELNLSLEEAKEKEIFYINKYNSYKKGGYNMTKGGDHSSNYKLTKEQIDQIKELLIENKISMIEIANIYKISVSLVSQICSGKKRNNNKIKRKKLTMKGSSNGSSKLTEEQVSKIKKDLIEGVSRNELKDKYNVSKSLIQSIATGGSWVHVEPKIPMKKKRNTVTKDLILNVKKFLNKGKSSSYIQYNLKVSPNTIVKIKKGSYDHLLD